MNKHTPEKIKIVTNVWEVYEIAGLTLPEISSDSFFKDAKTLKKLLDDRNDLLEAVIKAAIPLEAIRASVHWELAEELKDVVVDAVLAIRKVIAKTEGKL